MIARHLARLEAELRACVDADPALARVYAILVSIPGIGPVCAVALIADLPELGGASDKEIAALVGVAPMNWDSGASRGQRRIKGGRTALRAAMAMAALAAARANPSLRAFAERLRAAGKPHLVVLTAVLRKLVVLANALVRDNRLWAAEPA
jgi:transposase